MFGFFHGFRLGWRQVKRAFLPNPASKTFDTTAVTFDSTTRTFDEA
jgi:hypothetical protein